MVFSEVAMRYEANSYISQQHGCHPTLRDRKPEVLSFLRSLAAAKASKSRCCLKDQKSGNHDQDMFCKFFGSILIWISVSSFELIQVLFSPQISSAFALIKMLSEATYLHRQWWWRGRGHESLLLMSVFLLFFFLTLTGCSVNACLTDLCTGRRDQGSPWAWQECAFVKKVDLSWCSLLLSSTCFIRFTLDILKNNVSMNL